MSNVDASTQRKQDAADFSLDGIEGVSQYRWIRPSMLVVTTEIDGGPPESENTNQVDEEGAAKQRNKISQLMNSIWQLESSKNNRW